MRTSMGNDGSRPCLADERGPGEQACGHVSWLHEQAAARVPQQVGRVHGLLAQPQDGLPLRVQHVAGIGAQGDAVLAHCGQGAVCRQRHDGASHLCAGAGQRGEKRRPKAMDDPSSQQSQHLLMSA